MRSTSLDETPELFNILKGDMSLVGPRPQLIRDMVFMSDGQMRRHDIRPGLTGLAQINGRNEIGWKEKFEKDLEYCQKITLYTDIKIILKTIQKVLARDGINEKGQATTQDYGDWLLRNGQITREEYEKRQEDADHIAQEFNWKIRKFEI